MRLDTSPPPAVKDGFDACASVRPIHGVHAIARNGRVGGGQWTAVAAGGRVIIGDAGS